jgi:hypothetical protein
MARKVETMAFRQCLNPRCQVRFYPAEIEGCPRCDLTGVYVGVVAREQEVKPVEEEED